MHGPLGIYTLASLRMHEALVETWTYLLQRDTDIVSFKMVQTALVYLPITMQVKATEGPGVRLGCLLQELLEAVIYCRPAFGHIILRAHKECTIGKDRIYSPLIVERPPGTDVPRILAFQPLPEELLDKIALWSEVG